MKKQRSYKRYVAFGGGTLLVPAIALAVTMLAGDRREHQEHERDKTLYVWAGDQARVNPDFLAVIDFDEDSKDYGKVLRTVPIPPPGNVSNESHTVISPPTKRFLDVADC